MEGCLFEGKRGEGTRPNRCFHYYNTPANTNNDENCCRNIENAAYLVWIAAVACRLRKWLYNCLCFQRLCAVQFMNCKLQIFKNYDWKLKYLKTRNRFQDRANTKVQVMHLYHEFGKKKVRKKVINNKYIKFTCELNTNNI